MKRFLRFGLAVLILAALLVAGARWYLTSRSLANKVSTQVAELYGGDVKIEGVDVWVGNSTLTGLRLYEAGATSESQPWLAAQTIEADRSIFDFLSGNYTPKRLALNGAEVVFRFDKNGNLLTRLPSKFSRAGENGSAPQSSEFPEIDLTNCKLVLRQPDSELTLDNISAQLRRHDGTLVLTGSLSSPQWGDWSIKGSDWDYSRFALTLQSKGPVTVTPAMLKSVPFIPRHFLDEIEVHHGKATGAIELAYDLAKDRFRYSLRLQPTETAFSIPAIELTAENAHGNVDIVDGLVKLRATQGDAFGGKLGVDADLDFRSEATQLVFNRIETVKDNGLLVERFPKSWKFPPKITGKLEGVATLKVSIIPEPHKKPQILTEGVGKGQILNAKIAGLPADGPVGLALHPISGSFGFGVHNKQAGVGQSPIGVDRCCIQTSDPLPMLQLKPQLSSRLHQTVACLAFYLTGAQEKEEPKGKKLASPEKQKTSYFDIDLKMKDLDLVEVTKNLEFKLPFELLGKVSFQAKYRSHWTTRATSRNTS